MTEARILPYYNTRKERRVTEEIAKQNRPHLEQRNGRKVTTYSRTPRLPLAMVNRSRTAPGLLGLGSMAVCRFSLYSNNCFVLLKHLFILNVNLV